jgi:iron(III) transport system ATP-binding protein
MAARPASTVRSEPVLSVENLVKSYDPDSGSVRVRAVDDVSFTVHDGEMFTLLGPSGCGKTTTLRSVAGLEKPDAGRIAVDERVLFARDPGGAQPPVDVAVNRRGLGMVFQSYAIWPHMTVFDNVAFPLQVRRRGVRTTPKAEISERVGRVLEVMQLGDCVGRRAIKLSGGQQQRLALARALVTRPPLLLLDEPLSNLDAKLRESLRFELKRLQRELGVTSVYVTHDQTEALALSSKIAVMRDGKVQQIGRPRDIYERPGSRFVAEFIGSSNFLPGTVASAGGGEVTVQTTPGRLVLRSELTLPLGGEVIVSIRPESVRLRPAEAGESARDGEWSGEVVSRAFLGDTVDHVVRVGGTEVRARGNPAVSVEPGRTVLLALEQERLALVPVD